MELISLSDLSYDSVFDVMSFLGVGGTPPNNYFEVSGSPGNRQYGDYSRCPLTPSGITITTPEEVSYSEWIRFLYARGPSGEPTLLIVHFLDVPESLVARDGFQSGRLLRILPIAHAPRTLPELVWTESVVERLLATSAFFSIESLSFRTAYNPHIPPNHETLPSEDFRSFLSENCPNDTLKHLKLHFGRNVMIELLSYSPTFSTDIHTLHSFSFTHSGGGERPVFCNSFFQDLFSANINLYKVELGYCRLRSSDCLDFLFTSVTDLTLDNVRFSGAEEDDEIEDVVIEEIESEEILSVHRDQSLNPRRKRKLKSFTFVSIRDQMEDELILRKLTFSGHQDGSVSYLSDVERLSLTNCRFDTFEPFLFELISQTNSSLRFFSVLNSILNIETFLPHIAQHCSNLTSLLLPKDRHSQGLQLTEYEGGGGADDNIEEGVIVTPIELLSLIGSNQLPNLNRLDLRALTQTQYHMTDPRELTQTSYCLIDLDEFLRKRPSLRSLGIPARVAAYRNRERVQLNDSFFEFLRDENTTIEELELAVEEVTIHGAPGTRRFDLFENWQEVKEEVVTGFLRRRQDVIDRYLALMRRERSKRRKECCARFGKCLLWTPVALFCWCPWISCCIFEKCQEEHCPNLFDPFANDSDGWGFGSG